MYTKKTDANVLSITYAKSEGLKASDVDAEARALLPGAKFTGKVQLTKAVTRRYYAAGK